MGNISIQMLFPQSFQSTDSVQASGHRGMSPESCTAASNLQLLHFHFQFSELEKATEAAAALMRDDSPWMQPLFAPVFTPEHDTNLMIRIKATRSILMGKCLISPSFLQVLL